MDEYLLNIEGDTKNYNKARDIVLQRLLKDKVISQEQLEEYCVNWQIIIIKPNWFQHWKNKFTGDSEKYTMKFLKFD